MLRSTTVIRNGFGNPGMAKYLAFKQRTGITLDESVLRAVLVPSVTTTRLSLLGEKAMELQVASFLSKKYPKMPADAIESALKSYLGISALYDVATVFGMRNLLEKPLEADPTGRTGERLILSKMCKALGPEAAEAFVDRHFLSRSVDLSLHLNLENPRSKLFRITQLLGRPRPVARLLKETGRLSKEPVFLVGMYTGNIKIGQGYGSRMLMAEERAAKDALINYYLKEFTEMTAKGQLKDEDLPTEEEMNAAAPLAEKQKETTA